MARAKKSNTHEPLERKLWKAADKLRKNIDAAEYKHVVLGLIFLKYISDAFEELHDRLKKGEGELAGADPEDKNEYIAEKVFYVPATARWSYIQSRAKLPTVGKDVDDAMEAIEKDNPSLRGVLPKAFAQERLDKASLGGLIDLISGAALGTKEAQAKDVLGRVYEYFLGEFALAEGKKGGQFYTPGSVVRLLVTMLDPSRRVAPNRMKFAAVTFDPSTVCAAPSASMLASSLSPPTAPSSESVETPAVSSEKGPPGPEFSFWRNVYWPFVR